MKNPFKEYQEFVKKTPRNAFDKSFRNNLTLPFGLLVPDMVLDVTAGDSASIDASFAFNFNPMMFPVQTPIRITQYFFYVRYRNTWENYMDYRYNNKPNLVHPYIKRPASWWKTATLCDYMGIPTVVPSGAVVKRYFPFISSSRPSAAAGILTDTINAFSKDSNSSFQALSSSGTIGPSSQVRATCYYADSAIYDVDSGVLPTRLDYFGFTANRFQAYPNDLVFVLRVPNVTSQFRTDDHSKITFEVFIPNSFTVSASTVQICLSAKVDGVEMLLTKPNSYGFSVSYDSSSHLLTFDLSNSVAPQLNSVISKYSPVCFNFLFLDSNSKDSLTFSNFFAIGGVSIDAYLDQPLDISRDASLNPFCSINGADPVEKINALPFRAYEQVYNYYFRNDRVEPFVVDGETRYNKFGTMYADGADETDYQLKYRNWELDMLTSCLPTPQQGTAPIVGVDLRNITFQYDDRNYNFRYETAEDGVTLTGGQFTEEDVPSNVRRTAIDVVAGGFTINDLREANAMQIFLERNIRRGLRYRDQVKSHTGIDLDYNELEVPEFLGGFSHYVDMRSVTSAAMTEGAVLGDIAGQASAFKKASHKVNHFFREDGVVIGIICITPEPVYSQIVPKFYLRQSPLDYYNPEFSHLGMQPVPYAEVAPLQMYNEMVNGGTRTLQTVFGYNRPNYDMVSAYDEVHGYMRTTDRDFVMMRTFQGVPELGADFLHVKGEHLNDVFMVNDPHGHIARGQVAFQVYMKRPVPAVGEPRLQ